MMRRRTLAARVTFAVALATPILLLGAQAAEASWTIESPPAPSGVAGPMFTGVSCRSATSCVGVGVGSTDTGTQSFAETWNGSGWAARAIAGQQQVSELFDVSCSSATTCTAVGQITPGSGMSPLAEHWNGTSWAVSAISKPAGAVTTVLSGISCPAAGGCTVAGFYSASTLEGWNLLAEHGS
jgi:hypothetical protein